MASGTEQCLPFCKPPALALPLHSSLLNRKIDLLLGRGVRPGDLALKKVKPTKDNCPALSLSEDCSLLRCEMES
jgi:hypothetical protein